MFIATHFVFSSAFDTLSAKATDIGRATAALQRSVDVANVPSNTLAGLYADAADSTTAAVRSAASASGLSSAPPIAYAADSGDVNKSSGKSFICYFCHLIFYSVREC